jgi:signal transduction histidine kinase
MGSGTPRTALEAVTWRRLPVSRWPWRSAGYLLTTLLVAQAAAAALAVPAVPWLVLAAGGWRVGQVVALVLAGAVALAGLGPLAALPLAALERRRLRLADPRPVTSGHRPVPAGRPAAWLRARYTEPATWRELAYAVLLATVAPAVAAAALLAVPLALLFIASPLLVLAQQPGSSPVALGFGDVSSLGQTVPYVLGGLAALPLLPYLLTLAAAGEVALARALLQNGPDERLRAELTEVSRSRARLADAFETERRRIERDLHDGAQQRLVSLTLQLGLARHDLPAGSPAAETVAVAHEQAKQLMAELRELIHGIQPQVLTDLGLPAALGELADSAPVPVAVDAELPGRLPGQLEATAYFVVAEALTNVAKHSGAASARVTARQHRDVLTVEIIDDGRGGADPRRGTGLTGLADRVAVTGGRMLLSSPSGGPTLLRVEIPCA